MLLSTFGAKRVNNAPNRFSGIHVIHSTHSSLEGIVGHCRGSLVQHQAAADHSSRGSMNARDALSLPRKLAHSHRELVHRALCSRQMRTHYPPFIKNYMKIGPSTFISFIIIGLLPTLFSTANYGLFSRNLKPYYKSGSVEKQIRNRDDEMRYYKYHLLTKQPGEFEGYTYLR